MPAGFKFSVKASQESRTKRLKETEEETRYLLDTAAALDDRLGPVLFQLPPNMKKDLPRLQSFVACLPNETKTTFEFRHPTWFDDDVLELLARNNHALCISDTDELPVSHIDKTADWGYLRLRRVNYSEENLAEWFKRVANQNWKDAFVFFKHEDEGTGPRLQASFWILQRIEAPTDIVSLTFSDLISLPFHDICGSSYLA